MQNSTQYKKYFCNSLIVSWWANSTYHRFNMGGSSQKSIHIKIYKKI